MTMRWGPQLGGGGPAHFRLWAPDKDEVSLELDGEAGLPMDREPDGWFSCEAPAPPGTRYRFRVSPELAVPDPASRQQAGGVNAWSVVVDSAAHQWRCSDWKGRPWEEAVIQEVHVGVLGGFAGVAEHLPRLAKLGVTAIELMPVAAFGGTRNWGYDGVLPYAVAESYGTPDELKALVDRAHELGLMVLLDVVYNHFGPEGNYLGSYAAEFFDQHTDTPWGGAVAVSKEPVRRFFIDNALMWLREFRIDGLRFDAVHAIADDGFLDEMAQEIRQSLPDRHVHLVLENEHNDADRLAPGLYNAQWNDDFHNVLHVLLTGESEGYYEAFADEPTDRLARCLKDGFIYQGEKGRGKPSGHLPTTAFVSFLQNHDQIGNRAFGERLTELADPAALRAATALLLLCPHIPLLFMGDESGSRSPFLFFTDFHDELAEAVRQGRRKEFARFSVFADPEARERIPDPNAKSTFDQSVPVPGPDEADWQNFYAELLAVRRQQIVPRLGGAHGLRSQVLGDGSVAAEWEMSDGATLGISLNIGKQPVEFPAARGELVYGLMEPGAPGSFRAWLDR